MKKLLYFLIAVTLAATWSGCVDESTKDCPSGILRITTNWTAGKDVTIPDAYQGNIGPLELQLQGNYNERANDFNTGTYGMLFYNTPGGMDIAAGVATVQAAQSGFINPRPDHLFSFGADQYIQKRVDCDITLEMMQRTRDLYVVLTTQGGAAKDVQGIGFEIAGVAGTLDLATGDETGAGTKAAQTFAAQKDNYLASLRLLGVITTETQTITVVLDYGSGDLRRVDVAITPDQAAALTTFNDDKLTPLWLYLTMKVDIDKIVVTLDDWKKGDDISGEGELSDDGKSLYLVLPEHSAEATSVEFVTNGFTVRAAVEPGTGKVLGIAQIPASMTAVTLGYKNKRFELLAGEWEYDAGQRKIIDKNLVMVALPANLQGANTVDRGLDMRYVQVEAVDMSTADWTPVGVWHSLTELNRPFTGSYDGYNLPITNFTVNLPDQNYVGLFGYNAGTLRNINMVSATVTGQNYVAAICGLSAGIIDRCVVEKAVAVNGTEDNTGGVCGRSNFIVDNPVITRCINRGTVESKGYTGGICGSSRELQISDCFNYAPIKGGKATGGICGRSQGALARVENCVNYADITGTNAGGICGINEGTVIKCPNKSALISGTSSVGGICGSSLGPNVTDCPNSADVAGTGSYIGGICGQNHGVVLRCNNNGKKVSGSSAVGGISGINYISSGSGLIESCDNHASVYTSGVDAAGICARNQGKIRKSNNYGLTVATTATASYLGGICARNDEPNSLVEDCINNASVGTYGRNSYIGGICGSNVGPGNIIRCVNNGAVSGVGTVGGICGVSSRTANTISAVISHCINNGSVNASGIYVGGICGTHGGIMIACLNNADKVSGSSHVGGIYGQQTTGGVSAQIVETCVNKADITATIANSARVGGICGNATDGTFTACYSLGSIITPSGSMKGTICGANIAPRATFVNCYWGGVSALGPVDNGSYAGCTKFGAAGTNTGWPVDTMTGWALSSSNPSGYWLNIYYWTGDASQQYPTLDFTQNP